MILKMHNSVLDYLKFSQNYFKCRYISNPFMKFIFPVLFKLYPKIIKLTLNKTKQQLSFDIFNYLQFQLYRKILWNCKFHKSVCKKCNCRIRDESVLTRIIGIPFFLMIETNLYDC